MKKRFFALAEHLCAEDIKLIRKKLGLTQAEFAKLANISKKTVERWESGDKEITGPIVTLVKILKEQPQICEELKVPEQKYPLRLSYMCKDELCTIIDVDEKARKVEICNFTRQYMFCAFGKREKPTYEEYEEFLESRCFPKTRDKMKLVLKDLDLPFYDPLMIIRKTEGRMAEDEFWIRIEG